jgi:predicted Zn-dependent peptidase
MVIVVAGNVTEADKTIFEDYFGKYVNKSGSELPEVKIVLNSTNEQREKKEVEQGHFGIAVPTFGWRDKRKYQLRLLDIILAGNSSSRLFEEIRSKRGWAYYVFPVGESFMEAGFWGVQAGVKQDKLEEAIEVVTNEILNIGTELKPVEMERAKNYLKGRIELLMDRSDFWTGYVGQKLLLEGEVLDPNEEVKKILMVDFEKIIGLAEAIFVKNNIKKIIVSR